jgi:protein TonB
MTTHVLFSRPDKNLGKGLGLTVTVGVHVLMLVLLLPSPVKFHAPSQAPVTTRLISEVPVDKPEPIDLQKQPPLEAPRLTIPLPEIAVASEPASTPTQAAPVQAAPPTQASTTSEQLVDSLPQFSADYLNNPAPVYPRVSRRLREMGIVTLRVFVAPTGLPTTVELEESSGFTRLDESALQAVRQWKFSPARRAGLAIGAWVSVPIEFSLNS